MVGSAPRRPGAPASRRCGCGVSVASRQRPDAAAAAPRRPCVAAAAPRPRRVGVSVWRLRCDDGLRRCGRIASATARRQPRCGHGGPMTARYLRLGHTRRRRGDGGVATATQLFLQAMHEKWACAPDGPAGPLPKRLSAVPRDVFSHRDGLLCASGAPSGATRRRQARPSGAQAPFSCASSHLFCGLSLSLGLGQGS